MLLHCVTQCGLLSCLRRTRGRGSYEEDSVVLRAGFSASDGGCQRVRGLPWLRFCNQRINKLKSGTGGVCSSGYDRTVLDPSRPINPHARASPSGHLARCFACPALTSCLQRGNGSDNKLHEDKLCNYKWRSRAFQPRTSN
jgi:hypothetical protein